jgi:hypothetical protein
MDLVGPLMMLIMFLISSSVSGAMLTRIFTSRM